MLNREENRQKSKPETDQMFQSTIFIQIVLKINATCHVTECKISDFCGVMRLQLYEIDILNEHGDHNSLRSVLLLVVSFHCFPLFWSGLKAGELAPPSVYPN